MGKTAQKTKSAQSEGLSLGPHRFPDFPGLAAAFGADGKDYPPMSIIPEQFKTHNGPYQDVVSALFFRGGKLADYGLTFKPGINHAKAITAVRALLCSFEPKHEHKTATVAWALSEWCDGTPVSA